MRRILGPVVTALLLVGLGFAIYRSVGEQLMERRVVTIRGLIGSEKEEFFKDPEVLDALRHAGFVVQVEKAGSREIASFDLKKYDFAFPAGMPAAEKIRREARVNKSHIPFFTPMAVGSWRAIADILSANGMAQNQGGYYLLNIGKLIEAVTAGKRWKDLQHSAAYAVNKPILVSSTD